MSKTDEKKEDLEADVAEHPSKLRSNRSLSHRPGRTDLGAPVGANRLATKAAANYHSRGNNYSFDALQTNCFGINIKL